MIGKTCRSMPDALANIPDGATEMIGGFGNAGMPIVTVAVTKAKPVRKIIYLFPRQSGSHHFDALYRAGEIELELTPQGNAGADPFVTNHNKQQSHDSTIETL